ncbi:hypothetical protein CPB84DRAFT_1751913 [Gymnopilus junonius]|uniref:Uncharacterized protein n=1 Tax=Gymnopilus junonius TaxID=109634 RepID=A0A9P5THY3_GYMJU|nr:hypothetical protein CPB84DRAFT_1751913 [Gymnopilus junonius]
MGLASNSLVEGYFYVVFDSLPFSTAQLIYPITMHILSRLHLRLVNNPPTFLLFLYIPVLKDIWIEWVDQDHPFAWDLAFYANWLSRSSPSLQKLLLTDLPLYPALSTLTGIDIHSHHTLTRPRPHYDVLEALLMVVPNLRGLALPPSIHVALPILTDISNGTLLPNLEFLEIGANTIAEQNSIIQMVKFRNRNADASPYNFDFDSDSASASISEAVSATDLSKCSPIKTLNLIVPHVYDKLKEELKGKVEGLKLAEGYRIQCIPPCEANLPRAQARTAMRWKSCRAVGAVRTAIVESSLAYL